MVNDTYMRYNQIRKVEEEGGENVSDGDFAKDHSQTI